MQDRLPRKLAAILYTDLEGYSRLTAEDEEGTHRILTSYLDIITASIESHGGHICHFAGDAVLADFDTVVKVLECAVEIQRVLKREASSFPSHRQLRFRIGINLGDVIVDRGEVCGDGVSVAARLENLADPGGICISGTVFDAIGNKLPLVYEFMGEKSVKNIPRPIRAYRVMLDATTETHPGVQPSQPTLSLPDKPSIAVLPFNNLSGDPTRDYFSDGITEDIITNLSKFPELFVIARHSTFTYKGKPIGISQVGRDLGVRYVLEGSVQQAGNTVRITVQLVDAVTQHHLWAERYDGALEEVFAFQDEVGRSVAATMMGEESGALRRAETTRSLRKDPDSLGAYDYLLRGTDHYLSENVAEARQNFEKAIALDAGYAPAHKMLAWTHANQLFRQRSDEPQNDLRLAYTWAQKALALDNSDYGTHWVLGIIHLFRHDYDKSRAALLRARELNPNSAGLLATLGDASMYFGQPEDAIDYIKSAMRLNPRYPDWYVWALGNAYEANGQLELAIEELRKIENPSFGVLLDLAAFCVQAGRTVGAEEAVQTILKLDPGFSLKAFASNYRQMSWEKDPGADDEYIDALRQAGLPE